MSQLSLENQILRKCKHFNGVTNICCNAGIKYAEVRVGRPFQFPCLKQAGGCSKAEFPSKAEAKSQAEDIDRVTGLATKLFAKIRNRHKVNGDVRGEVDCDCGGKATYLVSSNSHISAKCLKCGIEIRGE